MHLFVCLGDRLLGMEIKKIRKKLLLRLKKYYIQRQEGALEQKTGELQLTAEI